MMVAVLDTTVILHLFRKYTPALAWFSTQHTYGVTSITWLEVMAGTTNKANQSQCKTLLAQFDILYPTTDDQTRGHVAIRATSIYASYRQRGLPYRCCKPSFATSAIHSQFERHDANDWKSRCETLSLKILCCLAIKQEAASPKNSLIVGF